MTVLLGENNSGKSTVLRAIGLFSQSDKSLGSMLARHELHVSCVNDPGKGVEIYLNTSRGNFYLKTTNGGERLEWECDNKILKETFKCQKIDNLTDTDGFLNASPDDAIMNHFIYGSSLSAPECPRAEKIFGSKVQQGNPRDGENYPIERMSCGRTIPARQTGSGDRQFRHIMSAVESDNESSGEKSTCRLFLLDEPETHLHPKAVQALVDMLWKASAKVQIILASHSPVLIEAVYNRAKNAYDEAESVFFEKKKSNGEKPALSSFTSLPNPFVSLCPVSEPEHRKKPEDYFRILSKDAETGIIRSQSAKPFLLNPVSADEINYCAFCCIRENYFVQLYDTLQYQWAQILGEEEIRQKDMDKIFNDKNYPSDQNAAVKKGGRNTQIKETMFTYQRNALAHPTNISRTFKPDKLEYCIAELRKLLSETNSETVSSAEKSTASLQASQLETGKSTDQSQT